MSENAERQALRSMGFTNDEMTAHGFRSLGSTMLNSLGYRPDVIEAALAHVQPGVRGVYNRGDYWEERVAMMQSWADWLDGLTAEGEGGNACLGSEKGGKLKSIMRNGWG